MGCIKLSYYEKTLLRGNILQTLQESNYLNENDDPGSITLRQTIDYDVVKRPTAVNLQINDRPVQSIAQTIQKIDNSIHSFARNLNQVQFV